MLLTPSDRRKDNSIFCRSSVCQATDNGCMTDAQNPDTFSFTRFDVLKKIQVLGTLSFTTIESSGFLFLNKYRSLLYPIRHN
jgi:hypothetical protein